MLLLIDNYDSFTYNIVQYLRELGQEAVVIKNDRLSLAEIIALAPQKIIISPGPGRPEDSGILLEALLHFADLVPILGICLGHQAIAQAFGGQVVLARRVMHGKASLIHHSQTGLFANIPSPLQVGRYHSLIVDLETLPAEIEILAWCGAEGQEYEIMGIQHKDYPIIGVQFHPESILSDHGHRILQNFLEIYQ